LIPTLTLQNKTNIVKDNHGPELLLTKKKSLPVPSSNKEDIETHSHPTLFDLTLFQDLAVNVPT
jgi:hypothetical protein